MITTTSNPLIINNIAASPFLGIILLIFVIVMVFLRESLQLFETPRIDLTTKMLDIIILPTLLAAVSVLVLRLLTIAEII